MILVPVPYLPGDTCDANHVRVENHHSEGLTSSTVRIDGWAGERYIRCVSRPDRPKYPRSYLVHLKPMTSQRKETLHCRNLPTICILEFIEDNMHWPTVEDYNHLAAHYSPPSITKRLEPGCRLIQRKQRKIVRSELVSMTVRMENVSKHTHVELTSKGRQLLEHSRVGN